MEIVFVSPEGLDGNADLLGDSSSFDPVVVQTGRGRRRANRSGQEQ
jgi:hypothetical protein